MKRVILDANVLIRFLRADHKVHFAKTKSLIARAEAGEVRLLLLDAVLAEVVFVLGSVYSVKPADIASALNPFLFHGGVECPGAEVLADALERFSQKNVDFIDAYLAAQAKVLEVPVCSFNRDFRKFKDIAIELPS
jgi:predicted nucleic acid-binding protein